MNIESLIPDIEYDVRMGSNISISINSSEINEYLLDKLIEEPHDINNVSQSYAKIKKLKNKLVFILQIVLLFIIVCVICFCILYIYYNFIT